MEEMEDDGGNLENKGETNGEKTFDSNKSTQMAVQKLEAKSLRFPPLPCFACAGCVRAGQHSTVPMKGCDGMLLSLSRMTGMPVVWKDQHMGYVERAVADWEARRLDGLIIRKGVAGARWVLASQIEVIGSGCIILMSRPQRLRERQEESQLPVFLTNGECAGEVTDVILSGETLSVRALEVCRGPVSRLLGRRQYASGFQLNHSGAVAESLVSWAQLLGECGEEDDG